MAAIGNCAVRCLENQDFWVYIQSSQHISHQGNLMRRECAQASWLVRKLHFNADKNDSDPLSHSYETLSGKRLLFNLLRRLQHLTQEIENRCHYHAEVELTSFTNFE